MMFYAEQLQGGNWFLCALFWGSMCTLGLLRLFSKFKYGQIYSCLASLGLIVFV